jgi:hypothetical protein
MNDRDVDKLLEQALSSDRAHEVLRQRVLRDSTAALHAGRVRRLRWRAPSLSAAAVLIAAVSFLAGRASTPRAAHEPATVVTKTTDDALTVNVPSELVAWLEAARFFKQLGMEQRVALAYERAGRLLPQDVPLAGSTAGGGNAYAVACSPIPSGAKRSRGIWPSTCQAPRSQPDFSATARLRRASGRNDREPEETGGDFTSPVRMTTAILAHSFGD